MVRFVIALLSVVLASSCAPSPSPAPPGQPGQSARPAGVPKRITTALRGDPKTLSEAINTEYRGGVRVIASGESQEGARKFASGKGRHGES